MVADTHTLADALPQGNHAAIIDVKSGHTLQASSLRVLVLSAAATLRASGVQPGQTVSIVDANTVSLQSRGLQGAAVVRAVDHLHAQVEFVVAFLGVTLARAVAAPLNASYSQVGLFASALVIP